MLFYDAAAPNPRRVRIFLAEKGLDLPRRTVDLPAGEGRTPEFLKLNALGEVPVLELDDGEVLTESIAICRYLEELHPEKPLFGRDARERARVEMWSRRAEIHLLGPVGNVARHTFEFFRQSVKQIPAFAESQREEALRRFEWADGELADGREFLAGDAFSVADITGMTASMVAEFTGTPIPDGLDHLSGWDRRMRARPSWTA
jgi:glutathione S-transferase